MKVIFFQGKVKLNNLEYLTEGKKLKNDIYYLFENIFDDHSSFQKQPSRGVLRKKCPEKMQQIYRRTPIPKCDFNKVA